MSFLHRMIRAEEERHRLLEQEKKKREAEVEERAAAQAAAAMAMCSKRQPTDSAREEIRRQVTAILAESAYDAEAMAMSSRGSSQITHRRGPLMDYPPMPDSPSHPRDDLRELSWSSSLSEKSNSLRQRSTGLLQRSYGSQRSRVLPSASLHGFLHLPLG